MAESAKLDFLTNTPYYLPLEKATGRKNMRIYSQLKRNILVSIALGCVLCQGAAASNFTYSGIEFGLSHSTTDDYINRELTLGDFESFSAFAQTVQYQTPWNPVVFLDGFGSYRNNDELQVTQLNATIGLKYPIPITESLDVVPGIGYHARFQNICFNSSNCTDKQASAPYYSLDLRHWLWRRDIEASFSSRNAAMEERSHWHSFGLAYWPSSNWRIGVELIDVKWAKETRLSFSIVL